MRVFDFARLLTIALIWAGAAVGLDIEDRKLYPANPERAILRVISTADLDIFDPILQAFQAENPGLSIDYIVTGTRDLENAIRQGSDVYDVAISSAMDLQTKLANDGLMQTYASPIAPGLPDWAVWRDQVFAFTQEPAVLVVSDRYFAPDDAPRNRDALINMLRDNADRFQGRVGTYDVRQSGFGYMVATQDSRNSEAFWRLMEVMGRLDAQLYCCSGDMIRDVASGKLALAYNVLGSYADRQLAANEGLRIVELTDFVSVTLRTALIPNRAENVAGARAMVDFLMQLNDRPDLVAASGLPGIDAARIQENPALRPIRFGPGLLVFLDKLKRASFLQNWESSLVQDRPE